MRFFDRKNSLLAFPEARYLSVWQRYPHRRHPILKRRLPRWSSMLAEHTVVRPINPASHLLSMRTIQRPEQIVDAFVTINRLPQGSCDKTRWVRRLSAITETRTLVRGKKEEMQVTARTEPTP